jgi:protein-tyrosine-phosphatase
MSAHTFKILFVCSGNSCRSPIAEGLMKIKLPLPYKEQVEVGSAGTLGLYGKPATGLAIQVASEFGADISRHRSQGMSAELVRAADIIFAMSPEHKHHVEWEFPEVRDNVFLLKSFDRRPEETEVDGIDDPIGGSFLVYRQCAEIIESELNRILPRLTQLISEKLDASGQQE